ncbi:MAG: hypothetical protein HC817_15580 [Saprospiraceae bacterium]|nr:hypothetical protein [Saprospiraceae bacterium]
MIQQGDDRIIAGLNTKYVLNTSKNKLTIGGGVRYDAIENALATAPNRAFSEDISKAEIKETAFNIYVKKPVSNHLKIECRSRASLQLFNFDIKDLLPSDANRTNYSGKISKLN